MIRVFLKTSIAVGCLAAAISLGGCGVSNTAQKPDDVPPMPSSGPVNVGAAPSSPAPTPPPPSP